MYQWGRTETKNGLQNQVKILACLRQFALNMLKKFPDKKKQSINCKKAMTAIGTRYLLKLWLQ